MTGQTGSNGLGISKEIAYTLNCAKDQAVCYENHANDSRVTRCDDGIVPTLSSRMGTGGGNVPFVLTPLLEEVGGGVFPDKVGTLMARDYKGIGRTDTWNKIVVTQE